jgi:hypothetical protein
MLPVFWISFQIAFDSIRPSYCLGNEIRGPEQTLVRFGAAKTQKSLASGSEALAP